MDEWTIEKYYPNNRKAPAAYLIYHKLCWNNKGHSRALTKSGPYINDHVALKPEYLMVCGHCKKEVPEHIRNLTHVQNFLDGRIAYNEKSLW
jgi:hypothetical protein